MRKNGATHSTNTAYEPPHVVEARRLREQTMMYRCPFCHADPGQGCRTHKGRGRELDYPHSRRIALTHGPVQADRQQALCCECGQLRTVSERYYSGTQSDPNRGGGLFTDPRGWFDTKSLKCEHCGRQTRHALLAPDKRMPEFAERYQNYVLGGQWDGNYAPDRERLRAEYFAQFPRNPNLHHRFWSDEADKLRAQGETHMPAVCGAIDEIPRSWSSKKPAEGELIEPRRIDWETEYEDPDTGEWWIDMQCVDCLRVANEQRLKAQRDLLLTDLLEASNVVNQLSAAQVNELREHLGRLMDNVG